MKTIRIKQVHAIHDYSWNKWPDSGDKDYSDILSKRWEERYANDDLEVLIENRYYPQYYPYIVAGVDEMPIMFPWIDNTKPPKAEVLEAMRTCLKQIGEGCQSIYWWHSQQCYPDVARLIPELFNFAILHFGDDCPGSSEIKTFPVAQYFKALVYSMGVWSMDSGEHTAPKYSALGLKKHYLAVSGTSAGLVEEAEKLNFNLDDKIEKISRGEYPPVDLTYVGFGGGCRWRADFLGKMMTYPYMGGISTRFHGVNCRDGVLGGHHRDSVSLAKLYVDSLFGVNPQVSSIYNSRLSDLWLYGVVQLIHDPFKELALMGFEAYCHYLPFDGTVECLLDVIKEFKADPLKLAYIIRNGYQAYKKITTEYNAGNALKKMYLENAEEIEGAA